MIKDAEVAMVHAASYALEAQEKNIGASVEEIIKHFLKESSYDIKSELKVYSVAAINEIIKMKMSKENKSLSNKQLIQMFVKNIPEFLRIIEEESED